MVYGTDYVVVGQGVGQRETGLEVTCEERCQH